MRVLFWWQHVGLVTANGDDVANLVVEAARGVATVLLQIRLLEYAHVH